MQTGGFVFLPLPSPFLLNNNNFGTPCQVGIKKKKERKENMREVDNEVSSRFFKWGFHYSFHT